jgi:hypothetical protein
MLRKSLAKPKGSEWENQNNEISLNCCVCLFVPFEKEKNKMNNYKYILMVKNNAFRGEEMSVSIQTNSSIILKRHINQVLNYGNLDFKVLVNTEIDENENEIEL